MQRTRTSLFAGTEKFAKGAKESSRVKPGPQDDGMVPTARTAELARKMKFDGDPNYVYEKAGMYSMDDVESIARS